MDNSFTNQVVNPVEEKTLYVPALVLGILSIPFGIIFALIGYVLSIVGIVLAVKNKNTYKTTAGLVCSIIGLVITVINSIAGIILAMGILGSL